MEEQNLVKDLTPKKSSFKEIILPALAILVIILVGGATGWRLSQGKGSLSLGSALNPSGKTEKLDGTKQMGIKDEESFPDKAEGRIEVNDDPDIPEGSHRLIRPGGPSKTAYLTSSVLDLSLFTGKCVLVWGQTFASQKVGWLMDIGYVEILDSCPEGL